MEQQNLMKVGDHERVLTQDELSSPLAKDVEIDYSRYPRPVTFAEAKHYSPFFLLTELHDQALHIDTREHGPQQHLAELALSAAVVHWWSLWQPIAMHRAFEAGAHIAEVAAASGLTGVEAYERWSAWADVQSQLIVGGLPCVNPEVVANIRDRLDQQMRPLD